MALTRRLFAVIPAAGHSRRMGTPKLLLPLGDKTVIARLLDVLDHPAIADRVVVLRRDDDKLASAVRAAGATVVQPSADPPEMRTSVEHALSYIEQQHHPPADDGWLLVPGDHPMLEVDVLNTLIERWQSGNDLIVLPTFQQRRGHPTLFRWSLAAEVPQLGPSQGLNALLHRHAAQVREIPVNNDSVLMDLDVPADYEALRQRLKQSR
jgi:molybdenum cofactor cytidylyltransferase